MAKFITAEEAAALIKDEDLVGAATMHFAGWPEQVAVALQERYEKTGSPKNITMMHSSACGDYASGGTERLIADGLVKRLVCAHTGPAAGMVKKLAENAIEGYFLPQGVITHLWRAIAGRKPGVITKVGLGTFVDPRLEGGKVTEKAKEDLVELVELRGEEWLLYKSVPVNVAFIRATTADEKGNLTMEYESNLMESLPLAMAAKNSGGIVIAQVYNVAQANTLKPKDVRVPGALVDYVVVADKPEYHLQTMDTFYIPSLSGELRAPMDSMKPIELDEKKIIARRATMELKKDSLVNLGVGIPAFVSSVANEEGVGDTMTLTAESGIFGGVPASGPAFGSAYNAEATIEMQAMFDFYDGGGIDTTFLGLAQADAAGNTNVSKFGPRAVGCGGFINITQNAKEVVFCGQFVVGAKYKVEDGLLKIVQEGKIKKFVKSLDQITFSGNYANSIHQPVLYVTERAVFKLDGEAGLTLIEIAPGMDLEKDIIGQMEFRPNISKDLKEMDPAIFKPEWGGLKAIIDIQ